MADRTIIIKQQQPPEDESAVWTVLLIAFALVLLAIVGYRSIPARTPITAQPASLSQPEQPAPQPPAPAAN